jgi:hypothetical protein
MGLPMVKSDVGGHEEGAEDRLAVKGSSRPRTWGRWGRGRAGRSGRRRVGREGGRLPVLLIRPSGNMPTSPPCLGVADGDLGCLRVDAAAAHGDRFGSLEEPGQGRVDDVLLGDHPVNDPFGRKVEEGGIDGGAVVADKDRPLIRREIECAVRRMARQRIRVRRKLRPNRSDCAGRMGWFSIFRQAPQAERGRQSKQDTPRKQFRSQWR